jgi:DNA-directed RNA polymerase specialized sigma24 family protein
MIHIKVGNTIFTIPENSSQDLSMTKIDWLAERFYETRDEKYINTLIQIVSKYVQKVANSFCKNTENVKELSQELKIDLLRLLRGWKPKKGMRFNYLMKTQFYHFSCNFIKGLKTPLVDIDQVQEHLLINDCGFVKKLETKDLVEKLTKNVDNKTKAVIEVMLKGITNYEQIGRELSITGMAVRNRIKKCKPILKKLMEEKYV